MVSSVGSPTLSSLSRVTATGSPVSSSFGGSYSKVPAQLPTILQQAQLLGMLKPNTPMSVQMVLPLSNVVGLSNLLTELYNPFSPSYHQFLSLTQFTQFFGPSQAELSALTGYMRSNGLQVQVEDASTTNLVTLKGTAQQMESVFKTQMGLFKYNGQSFYSAVSPPQLPKAFSNVQMVYGLQNYGPSASKAVPLYKDLGPVNKSQTTSSYTYYSPSEIRQAYNATTLYKEGYNGTGITIAIIDAYGDPYIQPELDAFDSQFNLPATNLTVTCVDGPCNSTLGITTGWNGEIALDVEWAHAMAPGAAIDLYIGSNSSQPLYDAVLAAVDNPSTNIISMSWAEPENDLASSASVAPVYGENYPWLDQVLQEAAAVGITSLASSGDWGAYDQSFPQTSPYGGAMYPSTDPYVTGVGGTSLYMNTTSGSLQFPYANATGTYGAETAWSWNNVYGWGTGGGDSTLFPRPEWQTGLGVSGEMRGAPDISWDADPLTGVLVFVAGGFYYFGGTSVGSPSLAGSLATLEQKAGQKLGLINPTLYSILNNKTEYSKAFHDVTVGNNNPNSASLGWDPLTGVGSPNLGELANFLAPTGSLDVVAGSNVSLGTSAPYVSGSRPVVLEIYAHAFNGGVNVTTGAGFADIASPSGALLGNITMSYNSTRGAWFGNYAINSTDPPGSWTATVHIVNDTLSGMGSTTFSVGDGVTLFEPYTIVYPYPPYFQVNQTIPVSAEVDEPNGTVVSSGAYTAVFTFQTTTGPSEGKIPLAFNSSTGHWEGVFTVPGTVDQGAWVLTVNGTDWSGNKGSTYSWLNVGLEVSVYTFYGPISGQFEQTPSFVLGDNITVLALPSYANGSLVSTGSFNATISSGSTVLGTTPLSFVGFAWVSDPVPINSSDPVGFYNITVSGNDGFGNSGSFYTVVRVAPYNLNVDVSASPLSIPGANGSLQIQASVSYPNGTAMKVGSVDGYVYLNMSGSLVSVDQFLLTYNNASSRFNALFVSQGPYYTPPGAYVVVVSAVDPAGNYGLNFTSFEVAQPHISLTPSSGTVGTSVTISGSGFMASALLTVIYDNSSIGMPATCTSDTLGNITSGCTFMVPSSVSGNNTVIVTDGIDYATATFAVVIPPLDQSFTLTAPLSKSLIGTLETVNATWRNNVPSDVEKQITGIVWFEVEKSTSGQTVIIVATSLALQPGASGSAYLGLSTLPPGTYRVEVFVTTTGGVPISQSEVVTIST